MYFYYFNLLFLPLSVIIDLFLKIKSCFWPDHSIRILSYHSISSEIKGKRLKHISVSPKVFAAQMKYLADNNFKVIDLDDLLIWKDANHPVPAKCIILSFDDGFEDNYHQAFPVLVKYFFKGVISVITGFIDSNKPFPWIKQSVTLKNKNSLLGRPLNRKQLKEMSQKGITIASHTRAHSAFSHLDKKKVAEEVFISKKELEEIIGKRIRYLAYPYGSWGDFNDRHKKIVRQAGYEAALSTKVGRNNLNSDFYELKRLPIFNIDGLSNFKRKVRGAYDFSGWIQFFAYKVRRLLRLRA